VGAAHYSWTFPGGTPAISSSRTPGSVTFATAGEYTATLTVTDASGNSDPNPPTRTVIVNPSTADFDIEVDPASWLLTPGQSAQFTVSVTPLKGFSGTVSLAVGSENGLPSGVTGSFSPASITGGSGTSTLTMHTTSAALPYAVSLTITGTSGTLSHGAA